MLYLSEKGTFLQTYLSPAADPIETSMSTLHIYMYVYYTDTVVVDWWGNGAKKGNRPPVGEKRKIRGMQSQNTAETHWLVWLVL